MMAPATLKDTQATPASEPRPKPEAVESVLHRMLSQSSYRALHEVRCDYSQGVLTLHGRVPSYYLKQLAQEMAKRVAHGKVINNLIRVIVPEF
jgi:hypothetical protein